MLEVTAVDSTAVNIHKISSVDDIDAEDVAKAQLKVLLGIQTKCDDASVQDAADCFDNPDGGITNG